MKIQIFLKTPLYRGHYGAQRDSELKRHVVEILGEASAERGGIEVTRIDSMYDDKGAEVEAPFERLFLPMGKVDYYVIT